MPTPPTARLDGHALAVLRQKDGHTITTLAALAGYSVGYINDLEKGRRKGNASVIRRLADVLNVPMSMLERRQDAA
jgi:transcriptional regulator with XRE-family HTH domain